MATDAHQPVSGQTSAMLVLVTSTTSLFSCPSSDVTLDRVRELVGQELPESLTLEYKEKFSSSLVSTVAAMANSYGGLILVGVSDEPGEERLAGVGESAITQIINACHDKLEPPWEPEVIPVLLGERSWILVVRVDPARAPRPLLVDGRAPIRLQGRNAFADRDRLARLFTDTTAPLSTGWRILPSLMPTAPDGSPTVDFMLNSGLVLPLGERAIYRPLLERAVEAVVSALNNSPLHRVLLRWSNQVGAGGLNPFSRRGFNRARHARLVWQSIVDGPVPHPIESVATVQLPDAYGQGGTLQFTLEATVAARALINQAGWPPGTPPWRLTLPDLYETMDGILTTLVDDGVVKALADLADVDPVVVPQPMNLNFITGPQVSELLFLEGLRPVPEAGPSRGATLIADPALDLRSSAERQTQLDSWLVQIALDGGLTGMEDLLDRYHDGDDASQ